MFECEIDTQKRIQLGKSVARYNGYRPWTEDEIESLISLYSEGLPHSHIAKNLQRSECSIRSKISKLHLSYSSSRRHKFTKEQDRYIKDNYGFIPVSEIAQSLGITFQSVADRATKRLNLKHRYFGENNPKSVFSDEDIELIRCLGDEGLSSRVIAEKFDASDSYVRKILSYSARTEPTFGSWKSPSAKNHLRSQENK